MGKVVPFQSSSGADVFSFHDEAVPYLQHLARSFPREMKGSLKSLGFHLKKDVENYMRRAPYPGISGIQKVRLLDAMRSSKKLKRRPAWRKDGGNYALARPRKGYDQPFGRMHPNQGPRRGSSVRYFYKDPMEVRVGFVTPSASMHGRAVQGGWRGERFQWARKSNRQFITPRMRRFLRAAGIHTKKQYLETPKRPVIHPVFVAKRKEIPVFLEKRVARYLRESFGKAAPYTMQKILSGVGRFDWARAA